MTLIEVVGPYIIILVLIFLAFFIQYKIRKGVYKKIRISKYTKDWNIRKESLYWVIATLALLIVYLYGGEKILNSFSANRTQITVIGLVIITLIVIIPKVLYKYYKK